MVLYLSMPRNWLLFEISLLRAEFRSFKNYNSYEYVENIKWEGDRSSTAILDPYQFFEVDRMDHEARCSDYVPIPSFGKVWSVVGVCWLTFPS